MLGKIAFILRRPAWFSAMAVLLGLIILLSPDLFKAPIIPYGDEASNSLCIFKARHFEQLLGNFSRWQFHHPGPWYFYLLAAGEFFFYDLLHLTPAAFNAQILSAMFLNVGFAAAALAIFRRRFSSPVFPGTAVLLLALTANAVNQGLPNLMLLSLWPPALLLANFLFFAAAAMAVATGDLAVLPAMVLGGALLAQGHAAQPPFVMLVSAGATAAGVLRRGHAATLSGLLRQHRSGLMVSAVVLAIVFAPVVMEAWKHDPDNIDAIQHYLRSSSSHFNPLPEALKFCAGFLSFTPNTERGALAPLSEQVRSAMSRGWPAVFWAAALALAAVAVLGTRRSDWTRQRPFILAWLLVSALAAGMFLVWALKLTGEFYALNGLFIYALHVLGLWTLCGLCLENARQWRSPCLHVAVLGALAAFVLWNAPRFRNAYKGAPVIMQALEFQTRLPSTGLRIDFNHDLWPFMMGGADALARNGKPFCVPFQWTFMFEPETACRNAFGWSTLTFRPPGAAPPPGALLLANNLKFAAFLSPPKCMSLPARIEINDGRDEKEGFYNPEQGWRWTSSLAHIRFRLCGERQPGRCHLVRITGIALPARPVAVLLNSVPLGMIEAPGRTAAQFAVAAGLLSVEGVNNLTFIVARAGPVEADKRQLGFGFIGAEIVPAPTCP